MTQDWMEPWIDQMGLIVALSAPERFERFAMFKYNMAKLRKRDRIALKEAIRLRFTPSNGVDGCESGTEAVREVNA